MRRISSVTTILILVMAMWLPVISLLPVTEIVSANGGDDVWLDWDGSMIYTVTTPYYVVEVYAHAVAHNRVVLKDKLGTEIWRFDYPQLWVYDHEDSRTIYDKEYYTFTKSSVNETDYVAINMTGYWNVLGDGWNNISTDFNYEFYPQQISINRRMYSDEMLRKARVTSSFQPRTDPNLYGYVNTTSGDYCETVDVFPIPDMRKMSYYGGTYLRAQHNNIDTDIVSTYLGSGTNAFGFHMVTLGNMLQDFNKTISMDIYVDYPKFEILNYGIIDVARYGKSAVFSYLDDDIEYPGDWIWLWGTNNTSSPYYGERGLVKYGIGATMGLWMWERGSEYGLYEDSTMTTRNATIDDYFTQVLGDGNDFELHTATSLTDNTSASISAIAKFIELMDGPPYMYYSHGANLENLAVNSTGSESDSGSGILTLQNVTDQNDGLNVTFFVNNTIIDVEYVDVNDTFTRIQNYSSNSVTVLSAPDGNATINISYTYRGEYYSREYVSDNFTFTHMSYNMIDLDDNLTFWSDKVGFDVISNTMLHGGSDLGYNMSSEASSVGRCGNGNGDSDDLPWTTMLSGDNLDELISSNGVFIPYVHGSYTDEFDVVGDYYVLNETIDQGLRNITTRRFWTPTALQFYDSFRQQRNVDVQGTKLGDVISYTITNNDIRAANGIQFRVLHNESNKGISSVEINGTPTYNCFIDKYDEKGHFWVDIPAGESRSIEVTLGTGIYENATSRIFADGNSTYTFHNHSNILPMWVTPSSNNVTVNVSSFGDVVRWIESSSTSSVSVSHVVGGFDPNEIVRIRLDGDEWRRIQADESGYVNFTYNGGFSDHEFEMDGIGSGSPPRTSGQDYDFSGVTSLVVASVGIVIVVMILANGLIKPFSRIGRRFRA